MTNQNTFDPDDLVNKFSSQWEKHGNNFNHLLTNNREVVQFSRLSSYIHTRFRKMIDNSQELLANQLNLPTKEGFANIAKLSIQIAEKLDSLEKHIRKLQDSVYSTNKEIESVLVEVGSDNIKLTKQLKTELMKTKVELVEAKKTHCELLAMKNELADLKS
ncbi:hypothetical protein [Neobacillus niacini]|uniref:hypothetical protein n=1 Tax=Neobacillus niacini TaxID=86668 RepID=UPI00069404A5|nr:hypothetical protein [Neobacillus niacini]